MTLSSAYQLRRLLLLLVVATLFLLPPCLSSTTQEHHNRSLQSKENSLLLQIQSHLSPLESSINSQLFLAEAPTGPAPSKIYKFKDLLEALPIVSGGEGIANEYFYLGEQSNGNDRSYEYGLVNLAAFLAQCIKETIKYDACDENNWDAVNGLYPVANACGQLEQSYEDYKCSPDEEYMECPVDPSMSIKATTNAAWWGAPGPLFCAPKTEYPIVGAWDGGYYCDNKWANPPESCDDYEGQKSGRFDHSKAVSSRGVKSLCGGASPPWNDSTFTIQIFTHL
jgi:hypothetical protein